MWSSKKSSSLHRFILAIWTSLILRFIYIKYTLLCVIVCINMWYFALSDIVYRSIYGNPAEVGIKYILIWKDSWYGPLAALDQGRKAFIDNKCEYSNCYVTDDRYYLRDPTEFHAVVFFGENVETYWVLPRFRTTKQKFVFALLESAHYYPICGKYFDNYFNWTWTFRLDSDVKWGYLTVYDEAERPVGPGAVAWRDTYDPLPDRVRKRLKTKHKAAAWFASNCSTKSKREVLVEKIAKELQLFNMTVDIYGACAQDINNTRKCEKFDINCNQKLKHEYYFYLAFENSFDKDYVTEKVLTAYNNYVVPIVYGDAEYSRFLPPGSYLNARDYSVKDLVQVLRGIMSNATLYEDFFRWKNHYRLKLTSHNEDLCKICAIMNDDTKLETITVYENFRQWWNGKHAC